MFEEMCCRPIVDGRKKAQTALALMRSRYSAFYWGDAAHLNRTQLNGRVEDDEPLFKVQWLGLTILSVEKGRAEDHEGRVEFAADFHQNGMSRRLREHSEFKKKDGHWIYVGPKSN